MPAEKMCFDAGQVGFKPREELYRIVYPMADPNGDQASQHRIGAEERLPSRSIEISHECIEQLRFGRSRRRSRARRPSVRFAEAFELTPQRKRANVADQPDDVPPHRVGRVPGEGRERHPAVERFHCERCQRNKRLRERNRKFKIGNGRLAGKRPCEKIHQVPNGWSPRWLHTWENRILPRQETGHGVPVETLPGETPIELLCAALRALCLPPAQTRERQLRTAVSLSIPRTKCDPFGKRCGRADDLLRFRITSAQGEAVHESEGLYFMLEPGQPAVGVQFVDP